MAATMTGTLAWSGGAGTREEREERRRPPPRSLLEGCERRNERAREARRSAWRSGPLEPDAALSTESEVAGPSRRAPRRRAELCTAVLHLSRRTLPETDEIRFESNSRGKTLTVGTVLVRFSTS